MHWIKPGSMRWFWASFTSLHISEERSGHGHLLWPWMRLRNFSLQRKWRWRFTASCLTHQTSSITAWHCQPLETTDLREVAGWWLCSLLLKLFLREQLALPLTCSMQEMVPETSFLLVPPLLQPIRTGRWASSCAPSVGRDIFPMQQPEMGSEWSHLISCSTPSLPDQCDHTEKIYGSQYQVFPWMPLLRAAKLSLDWVTVFWALTTVQSAWLVFRS